MPDDRIIALRRDLHLAVHGGAWHGPSLLESLAEVSFASAVARPIPGAHSIAALTHHATGWLEEVCRRLEGAAPAMPARGDWPSMPPTSAFEWSMWMEAVATAAAMLDVALASFPVERLGETVGTADGHDAPLGSGVTYEAMISGVIQHTVYHAGQIVLLARAAR